MGNPELSRRDLLKFAPAALGVTLFPPAEPQSVYAKETPADSKLKTNFAELSQNGDREGMVEAVQNNIDVFRGTKSRLLLELCEPTKVKVDIGDMVIGAPLYQAFPDAPTVYITKPGEELTTFMPNLGSFQLLSESEQNGQVVRQCEVQGIYLGRTENILHSENAGDVTVDVGYWGMYFGDPQSGEAVNKVVIPGILGDRPISKEYGKTPVSFFLLGGKDAGAFIYGQQHPSTSTMDELLSALDSNVGNGVNLLQVDFNLFSNPDIEAQIEAVGWPVEFYREQYILDQGETTKKLYDSLRDITLTRAVHDGFILNQSTGTPDGNTNIQDMFPTLGTIGQSGIEAQPELINQIKNLSKGLPSSKLGLNNPALSIDQLVKIPRITGAIISPTSNSL